LNVAALPVWMESRRLGSGEQSPPRIPVPPFTMRTVGMPIQEYPGCAAYRREPAAGRLFASISAGLVSLEIC
jgi:hypothetical protein